jgi:hypothetical protein
MAGERVRRWPNGEPSSRSTGCLPTTAADPGGLVDATGANQPLNLGEPRQPQRGVAVTTMRQDPWVPHIADGTHALSVDLWSGPYSAEAATPTHWALNELRGHAGADLAQDLGPIVGV